MASQAPPNTRRSTTHGDVYIGLYKRLEIVGKGSFANVYRGLHPTNGTVVAIKTVHTNTLSSKLRQNLTAEIDILKSMKHPHIVDLIQCLESANHIHLVMEFCQIGDMATFVRKRHKLAGHPITAEMMRNYPNPPGAGFNEVVVRHFSRQLSSALEYLRAKNLVHRDLKPQNLLLDPPLSWSNRENIKSIKDSDLLVSSLIVPSLPTLKIADFGFARHLPTTTLAETLCGSPLYMAPEILRYERYDAKADLWSVGAVLYELIVGVPPFRAANHVDLLRRIEKAGDRIPFDPGLVISDDMKILIRALLKKMPTERLSWEGYFQSPVNTTDIPGLAASDKPKVRSSITSSEPPQVSLSIRERHSSTTAVTDVLDEPERMMHEELPVRSPIVRTASTNAPPNLASGGRQAVSPGQPQRPALVGHMTAPAAQIHLQERNHISTSEAVKTRGSPSPGTSIPKEVDERQLEREKEREREDRERQQRRIREKALRETRERAAQDVAFERDYVMVEKRAVEVNAFADAMAASPQVHGTSRAATSGQPGAMARRVTTSGAPLTLTGQHMSPTRQMQVVVQPEGFQVRKRSWEARYPPNKISATSAIAAALNTVNFRLTGGPLFPSFGKGPSPPQAYPAFPLMSNAHASPLLLGDSPKTAATDDDSRAIATVEERATRSDVVYGFAEVKFKQLTPMAPSTENTALGLRRTGSGDNSGGDPAAEEDDGLTVDAIVEISEEALVLYVKTLSILQNTINMAERWWHTKNRGEIVSEQLSLSPRSSDNTRSAPSQATMARINSVVQWARSRFNECIQKSEYASRRLTDAQKKLPANHPGNPINRSGQLTGDPREGGDAGNDDIYLSSGATAEKLMYERALEMNKSAAVNELVGEDLPGCELSYATAIRLLEAVLEKDDEQLSRQRNGKGERHKEEEDDAIEGLEEGDRETVVKIIKNTKQRLSALRQKIATRSAARRNSLKAAPPSSLEPPTQSTVPASLPARLSPGVLPAQ